MEGNEMITFVMKLQFYSQTDRTIQVNQISCIVSERESIMKRRFERAASRWQEK